MAAAGPIRQPERKPAPMFAAPPREHSGTRDPLRGAKPRVLEGEIRLKDNGDRSQHGSSEWRHVGVIGGRDTPTPIWDVARRVAPPPP